MTVSANTSIQSTVVRLFIDPKRTLSELDPATLKEVPVRVALATLALNKDPEIQTTAQQMLNSIPV